MKKNIRKDQRETEGVISYFAKTMTRTEIEIKNQISIIFENKFYRCVEDILALTRM